MPLNPFGARSPLTRHRLAGADTDDALKKLADNFNREKERLLKKLAQLEERTLGKMKAEIISANKPKREEEISRFAKTKIHDLIDAGADNMVIKAYLDSSNGNINHPNERGLPPFYKVAALVYDAVLRSNRVLFEKNIELLNIFISYDECFHVILPREYSGISIIEQLRNLKSSPLMENIEYSGSKLQAFFENYDKRSPQLIAGRARKDTPIYESADELAAAAEAAAAAAAAAAVNTYEPIAGESPQRVVLGVLDESVEEEDSLDNEDVLNTAFIEGNERGGADYEPAAAVMETRARATEQLYQTREAAAAAAGEAPIYEATGANSGRPSETLYEAAPARGQAPSVVAAPSGGVGGALKGDEGKKGDGNSL